MQHDWHLSVLRSSVYKARTITNSGREAIAHRGLGPPLNSYIGRPVTASKSRACREEHTSGPCRWLFSAADFGRSEKKASGRGEVFELSATISTAANKGNLHEKKSFFAVRSL